MLTNDKMVLQDEDEKESNDDDDGDDEVECVAHIKPYDAWKTFQGSLVQTLFNNWRARSNMKHNALKLFVLNSWCYDVYDVLSYNV